VRIIETGAIIRYLNDTLPGASLVPASPKDRARMDMTIGLIDSYGYAALLGGVTAYHLFPDFVGGKNEAALAKGLADGRKALGFIMGLKGADTYIAGGLSLADLYLAPLMNYLSKTPDYKTLSDIPGLDAWWTAIQALPSFITSGTKHG
jgi:glutathione S-transferase